MDRLRGCWGAWLVYLGGAVAFWWPMPAKLATHVHGDRFDAWTTLWLMWHVEDRLDAGALTAVTDRILYPVGYNLWSFGHAALQGIGVLMMWAGLPLIVAYNLLLILATATSGAAAHLLGKELGGTHAAGFAAGVVFATSPYLYGEGAAGCIELVAAGLLPLHVWLLVRLAREPSWRRMMAAAAGLAIIGPFNWYYTLFAGMLGAGFAAWRWLAGERRAAALMLASFALAGLSNAPLIPLVRRETPTRPPLSASTFEDAGAWERARELADGRVDIDDLTVARAEEADAMQVPQNTTTVRGLLLGRFTLNPLGTTPGALATVVGIAGALLAGKRARGWLVLAAGATLLTLGPFLMVDDTPPLPEWSATIPLPYALAYQWVPFFAKAYRPYRIGVIALTCLAAAAASGVPHLRERLRAPILGLLALLGFTQPFWAGDRPGLRELADARTPPLYDQLRALPDGAVIELPLQYQPLTLANARLQYNQVAHGKPLLNCNQLIRRTELVAFRDYVRGNTLLRTLLDAGRIPLPWRFSDRDVTRLVDDGFRYLVLHRRVDVAAGLDAAAAGEADRVAQPLPLVLRETFGPPVLEDAAMQVFAMPGAWRDEGRVHTWDTPAVEELALPLGLDAGDLPIRVPDGGTLALGTAQGRLFSVWARLPRHAEGEPAAPAPAIRVGEATPVVPDLVADAWTLVELPMNGDAPITIELLGAGEVLLTRLQVVK